MKTDLHSFMNKLVAIITVAMTLSFWPQVARADDLFQLFWRGTYYTTNATGHITATSFTEQDFVNMVAHDNGIDPSQLIFVFRPNKRDTAVVWRSNGGFVADVIQFEYGENAEGSTDITNGAGTAIVRHALLWDEYHQLPIGSFFGYELPNRDAQGNLKNDRLVGLVIYGKPELGTAYSAHVSTGARVVDTSGG